MRILVADDDRVATTMLVRSLERRGQEVLVAHDGAQAWEIVRQHAGLSMAILDWEMPGIDGPELCRRIRQDAALASMYVILLTAREARSDVVAGLDAGADDYLVKPFDLEELRARVDVGIRVLALQQTLAERVTELQDALSKVKQLTGLLPICSYCKRIRSDENYWEKVESYISEHTNAQFSHGICPPCLEKVMAEADETSAMTQARSRSDQTDRP
jgi:sigma-B regulation protein RsbU (phosphoserine phosphatase)